MSRLTPIIVLVLALALVSCAGSSTAVPSPSPTSAPAALDGRQFLSISITQDGVARQLVPGTRIALQFREGRLGASAGCNLMGAVYWVAEGRLWIGQAGVTEMGCDAARHAQDEWLFAFLGSGPTLRLSGADLVLESGTTIIGFLDREVAEPDQPLVGPTWTVVSIIAGDAVSSAPLDAVGTLTFLADGRVRIATGCNEGDAGVSVESGTLRFTDVVLTKRACTGGPGQLEAAMLAVLRADAVAFQIEAQTLELRAAGGGLQLQGR